MLSLSKLYMAFLLFFILSVFAIIMNTNVMKSTLHSASLCQCEKVTPIRQLQTNVVSSNLTKGNSFFSKGNLSKSIEFRNRNSANTSMPVFISSNKQNLDDTPFFQKNFTPAFVLGKEADRKVSVVIGIPSVKRAGIDYLHGTLRSLFFNIHPNNEDRVAVVVMLAETDKNYVENQAKNIQSSFTRQVTNGLLQIISPDPSAYPEFSAIPKSLGDSEDRVKWRSKEVYDAAYLMNYCQNKADYYLMLEDDVIAAKGYAEAILDFAYQNQDADYLYLSFTRFSSIGKLFRASDISTWVAYFLTFYEVKPIDWLMHDFAVIKYCIHEMPDKACGNRTKSKQPQRRPSVFQHVGIKSSLEGKIQKSLDKKFLFTSKTANQHRNPIGIITSTMTEIQSKVEKWYTDNGRNNNLYYVSNASADQCITIEFKSEQIVSRILVKTGSKLGKSYKLTNGTAVLEVLSKNSSQNDYEICAGFDHNGEAECRFSKNTIKSVRIRIVQNLFSAKAFDLIYIG